VAGGEADSGGLPGKRQEAQLCWFTERMVHSYLRNGSRRWVQRRGSDPGVGFLGSSFLPEVLILKDPEEEKSMNLNYMDVYCRRAEICAGE